MKILFTVFSVCTVLFSNRLFASDMKCKRVMLGQDQLQLAAEFAKKITPRATSLRQIGASLLNFGFKPIDIEVTEYLKNNLGKNILLGKQIIILHGTPSRLVAGEVLDVQDSLHGRVILLKTVTESIETLYFDTQWNVFSAPIWVSEEWDFIQIRLALQDLG